MADRHSQEWGSGFSRPHAGSVGKDPGIPHFWRVEKAEGRRPVVYVYELHPATSSYALTGIHHDRLKADRPFPVDIDLTEIDRL